jgi:hypothetical protein
MFWFPFLVIVHHLTAIAMPLDVFREKSVFDLQIANSG